MTCLKPSGEFMKEEKFKSATSKFAVQSHMANLMIYNGTVMSDGVYLVKEYLLLTLEPLDKVIGHFFLVIAIIF